jgi:ligand-binding sensor domain-containing protein
MKIITPLIIRCCLRNIRSRYFLCVALVATLCILFFPQVKGTCHELSFHSDTVEQFTLPDCAIAHMMQDTTGYLWIATTCGLYKYDGYTFREYRHVAGDPNSLSHNRIRFLLQDQAGVIWVGTQGGGFNRYNPDQDNFEKIQPKTGNVTTINTNGRVTSMLEDRSGRIWIGTFEGLNVLSPDRSEFEFDYQSPDDPVNLKNEWIRALHEDSEGFVWVATRFKGLYRYDPVARRFEDIQKSLIIDESSTSLGVIVCLYEDSTQHLWIGTSAQGMYRMDPQRSHMIRIPIEKDRENLPLAIQSISEDADRNIWAATSEGLFAWSLNADGALANHTLLPVTRPVISGHIGSLLIDRFGMLWAGFYDGGLTNINLEKLQQFTSYYFSQTGGSKDQNITSMCEDRLGNIWVKTDNNDDTVWTINPSTRKHRIRSLKTMLPEKLGPHNDVNIRALAADEDDNVWILSDKNTLMQIDPDKDQISRKVSLVELLPDTHPLTDLARFLVVDGKNRFWIAGRENLFGPIFPFWDSTKSIESPSIQKNRLQTGRLPGIGNRVIFMYEGPSTGIWAVTGPGRIYRYHEKKDEFRQYIVDFASTGRIDNVTIFDIYEDHDGWLWIAADIGLIKLDAVRNQIVAYYNSQNGLYSEVIKGIVQDNAGNFWLGSLNGLIKFDPKTENFIELGIIDAFFQHPVMRVSSGRALKSHSNRIYFSSRNGFVGFDPAAIKAQSTPPEVVINDVKIYEKNDAKTMSNPSMIDSKQQWLRNKPLILPSYRNALQIGYAGIHFTSPEQNQYAVMLEGADADWQYVDSKRSATYANLSPGKYVFRVKAANSHGVWNETGASLDFEVLKPYWTTWWFLVLTGSVFILFLVAILKVQENRSQKQKKVLEIKVAERTRALEDSKKNLQKRERLETLARMRRLQEDIANISEHERKRVGQMFHEDLSPHLMGTETLMHVLVSQLEKELPQKVTFAKKIEDLIHGGIDKARNLAHGLAPRLIAKRSLREVLDELAEFTSTTFNISCHLHMQGTEDIENQDDMVHIFYIVQEAVYNAVKHADANHIQIHLGVEKGCLEELIISDNGSGFVEKTGKRGMGLRIMKIRAQALGASLEIQKKHEGGTRIRVVATKEAQCLSEEVEPAE